MKKPVIIIFGIITALSAIVAVFLALKAGQAARGREMVDKQLSETHFDKIPNLGTVDSFSVLPLVDFYSENKDLETEAGVSYLIKAGDAVILMDTGYNKSVKHPSPLIHNMEKLGIKTSGINMIFISHIHPDHVGGLSDMKHDTFSLSQGKVPLEKIPVFAPGLVQPSQWNPGPVLTVVDRPMKIRPGIASIGAIPRYLFIMGLIEEQVLAVNVKGKGIALIVGCGHPGIERILDRAKMIFNEPVYAVIGGLHFPVHGGRGKIGPIDIQYIVASDHAPWDGINEGDVDKAVAALTQANVSFVVLSPHDSSDWSLNRFKEKLGSVYRELRVGEEIRL